MSTRLDFSVFGGRKVAFGLLAAVLLTVMAFPLKADFVAYSGAILLALGLTQGSVAYEDSRRPPS